MVFRRIIVLLLIMLCSLSIPFSASADSNHEQTHPNSEGSITWPEKQVLPNFKKVKHLDVADVLDASGDVKLLMATLQGNVNRVRPRIYMLEDKEEGKMTWLNDLDVPYNLYDDYWDIVKKYKDEVDGLIIYDPEVPDSVNVATTMAGLKNGIVVSPELAKKMQAAPYNLSVIEDLRGRFKDKLDAYNWAFKHLWPKTTHRMLIGLSPVTSIKLPPNNWEPFKTVLQEEQRVRDSSNRDTYDIDLSNFLGEGDVYLRFQDAFSNDGWGPSVHQVTVKADGKVVAQFVPGTSEEDKYLYDHGGSQFIDTAEGAHRFSDGGAYFVYRFTPPAGTKNLTVSVEMWNQFKVSASNVQPVSSDEKTPYGYLRDYAVANRAMVFTLDSNNSEERALFEKILSSVKPGTPYLGWFSSDTAGEFSGTQLTSEHGVEVIAADWFSNLTVFSGTRVTPHKQKAVKVPDLKDKIYVTFTFSEGDNFQYNEHHMRNIWDDPARGEVPINWTSSPLLYDGAPAILDYYQKTATQNDLLIAGPSGAGYFYPNVWPEKSFPEFLKRSYSYLKKSGMTIPYVLNRIDSQNVPLSESKAAAYQKYYKVPGLFLSWEDQSNVTIQNGTLPVSTIHGVSTVQDAKNVLADAKANWDGQSPLFISIGLLAWNMSPSDVVDIADSLGPEYQIVRADQYFSLIREAHGLPVKPKPHRVDHP